MKRPWNFSSGPAALPLEVLQQASQEMCDWQGSGMSVMEMSHRGKHFSRIRAEAEEDLRALLGVPENFRVLFMQAGATAQNAILALNLMARKGAPKADYVLGGAWSRKSHTEAGRYGDAAVAASAGTTAQLDGQSWQPWCWLPEPASWQLRPDAAYLHVCSNETIGGVEYAQAPDLAALGAPELPLVLDVSSNILARPIDFSRVAMAYAGAQKNAGPAGLTLVIVRDDLLGHAVAHCPSVFDYAQVAAADSMLNTPPTYAIYIAGLVYKWLLRAGGVAAMDRASAQKSAALYGFIDGSELYRNQVHPAVRSRTNIPFQLADSALEAKFLEESAAAGLLTLKGHKSVGGMRASIYNALPLQAVEDLIAFMRGFEARHG